MAGYDINFALYIRDKIHEWDFWEITSILFSCLIQTLCDAVGVEELSSIDHLIMVTRIIDIGLIRDETNLVAQEKGQPST